MEVTGKIIECLPGQSGVSRNGNNWKKREYVLETQDSFPRKIHFDFFGERADQYPLAVGDNITLSFDIESREYNGRWYTSIRGWKAEKGAGAQAAAAAAPPMPSANPGMVPPAPTEYAPAVDPMSSASSMGGSNPTDDLPF